MPSSRAARLPTLAIVIALCLALQPSSARAQSSDARLLVRAQPLETLWQIETYSAPAAVVARNAPQLAAQLAARVTAVKVDVGDAVAAGSTLVELDCRAFEATLASARAGVARAEARERFAGQQLARARDLQAKNSISEEILDQRRNELAVARADSASAVQAERLAGIDVGHCQVAAPFDAVVTRRLVSVGSYVTPGTVVMALLELSGEEIEAALRTEQVASLHDAREPAFEAGGIRYGVTLRTVLPLADPVARTRLARLGFVDDTAIVGTAGRLTWQGKGRLLPPDYLLRRQGRPGVFVLQGETARFVPLALAQDGRPVAVDLPGDTLVVVEGQQSLTDGATVDRRPDADATP
jgi:RND family efflux transporter MFP subunit